MAKRVIKPKETSSKQAGATRRTKKTKTSVKKTPTKSTTTKPKEPTVTSGKEVVKKTPPKSTKKVQSKKPLVTSGKKPTKKTTKTTLAAIAIVKAENETKALAKQTKINSKIKGKKRTYILLAENDTQKKFWDMGEKIRLGTAKWSHYAIDGEIGYHHYVKL